MDRRDRRQCAGLVRARTETGLVAPARGGRIPGLPSRDHALLRGCRGRGGGPDRSGPPPRPRSEEHTSELQSQSNLVCRLLLEKKKKKYTIAMSTATTPRPPSPL